MLFLTFRHASSSHTSPLCGPLLPILYAILLGRYRVQYAQRAFAQEVQTVRVSCAASPEIQVVATDAQDIDEVQLVHAVLEDGENHHSMFHYRSSMTRRSIMLRITFFYKERKAEYFYLIGMQLYLLSLLYLRVRQFLELSILLLLWCLTLCRCHPSNPFPIN